MCVSLAPHRKGPRDPPPAFRVFSSPTKVVWILPALPVHTPLPPVQAQHEQDCRMAESAAWLLGNWPQGQAWHALDLGWT